MDYAGSNTKTAARELNRRQLSGRTRLTLVSELGGALDGAWWPYTSSVAKELPELIEALERPLGQIVDIGVNWSPATRHDRHRQSSLRAPSGHTVPDQHSARRHAAATGRRAGRLLGAPRHRRVQGRRRHRPRRPRRTPDVREVSGLRFSVRRCADGPKGCDADRALNRRYLHRACDGGLRTYSRP